MFLWRNKKIIYLIPPILELSIIHSMTKAFLAHLTLKAPITTVALWQTTIFFFFFFFQRKQVLADDSHEMSRLVFSEMSRLVFSEKKKKKKFECRLLQILLGALRVKNQQMLLHLPKKGEVFDYTVDAHDGLGRCCLHVA